MSKDTIYRGDAIDEMERIMADHPLQGYEDELLLINAIKGLPSADRWIPCSEGMPKKTGYYICTCKDGSKYKRTTVVKWSNGWQLTGSRTYWVVVAWMPLPEPYQPKGEQDE